MRALVLGGTQFMGRATVAALLEDGWSVTILTRGRTPNPFEGSVRHVCCDRHKDPAALAAFFRSEGDAQFDAVVDFTAFGPAAAEPILAHAPATYLFISSDSVYMACNPAGFVRDAESGRLLEGSADMPDTARGMADDYGRNKLALERRVRTWAASEGRGTACVALRLPDVLGPHENTGRLRRVLLRLLQGKGVGTAFGERPAASARIGLVFADDVAAAVVRLLHLPVGALPRGACTSFHVCSAEAPTWSEVVTTLADCLRGHGLQACGYLREAAVDATWQPPPPRCRRCPRRRSCLRVTRVSSRSTSARSRRSTRKSSERRPAEGGQRAISASRSHARSTGGSARCARGSRRGRPGIRAQRGSHPQERVLYMVIRNQIRSLTRLAVTTRQTHRRSTRAAMGRRKCGGGRGRSRRASGAECLEAVSPTIKFLYDYSCLRTGVINCADWAPQ